MEFAVDWNAVCLVCLQEGDMVSIYEKEDDDITLSDKIMKCSSIEIKPGMSLPENICSLCLDDLKAAYRFRANCDSTNVVLKSLIDSNTNDFEIPSANGETYRFKLPQGLRVKRVKACSDIVKSEALSDSDEHETIHIYDDDHYVETEEHNVDPLIKTDVDQSETIQVNLIDMLAEAGKQINSITTKQTDRKPLMKNIKLKKPKLAPIQEAGQILNVAIVKNSRKLPKPEKPPKICEICGNSYKYQHALDSHMRRHRNEKPYPCEFCDRAFVASVELRRHMRVHTGDKPYACQFCERRFSDYGSRIKHERTHTGERPYKCPTCDKAFAYAHVLNVHKLTHTGEKKYKCQICSKGFTKKSYLDGHMKIHGDMHTERITIHIEPQNGSKLDEIIYIEPKNELNEVEVYYES